MNTAFVVYADHDDCSFVIYEWYCPYLTHAPQTQIRIQNQRTPLQKSLMARKRADVDALAFENVSHSSTQSQYSFLAQSGPLVETQLAEWGVSTLTFPVREPS